MGSIINFEYVDEWINLFKFSFIEDSKFLLFLRKLLRAEEASSATVDSSNIDLKILFSKSIFVYKLSK